jgi:methyltransferase-like protein/2-polyprenyl-3-methyl-5-hydroxy-6-metoxy-1,4-benzoquinol methylase
MTKLMQSAASDHILQSEYNKAPYQSFAFNYTHPKHLYTLAKLFGLTPKPVENARVLELGCASGGNIIPMAYHLPLTEFVGIDLSETQINEGLQQIADLNITNLSLRHQSILNFEKTEGKFDYIICHGVYSWVDQTLRDKILDICFNNLSKDGIVYISYNTFPGWNLVNSFRELMLWHTKDISDPVHKAEQARAVLHFIGQGLENENTPYAQLLRKELDLISRHNVSYLLHDHLSTYNDPIYFYQFMDQANQHQLIYLADAFLSTMYTDNLNPVLSEELKKINNIVIIGQYMDFIRNQRFRCTLLCHDDQKINRALNTTAVEPFYLQFNGSTDNPGLTENDNHPKEEITYFNNLITVKARNPISQLAMIILNQERNKPIHYNTLCERIARKHAHVTIEQIKHQLNDDLNLMRCVLAGLINIDAYPGDYTTFIEQNPLACPLVRYQATKADFVVNRRHQSIGVDLLTKILLAFCDGTQSISQIRSLFEEKVLAQNIVIPTTQTLPELFQTLLQNISDLAMLIYGPTTTQMENMV